jgi:amino acid adenylation domain-containing protein
MSPAVLLADLIAKGVHLWAEGDELCLNAPKGVLTPALRESLKACKADMVALLGQRRKYAAASYSQRRLWFFDQLEPNSATYNMHLTYRLSGALDVVALEQSLNAIVRRHETLRTSIITVADQPAQVIAQELPFQLTQLVLDSEGEDEQARLGRQIESFTRAPFSLANAPLMRACLIQLRPDVHVLVLVLHHIIADGWSLRVVLRELAELYRAYSRGADPNLHPLPLQYADFARSQHAWLKDDLDTRLAYWREQLAGPPPPLMLATDRPRPAYQTFDGGREILEIDATLNASLQRLSAESGATLFMTLLAAFEVLLYRYTGQEDFVVGSPVAGRTHPGTEGLIGFFVNTVALRAKFDGNPSFRDHLRRTRETVLHAFEHQDLPFEKLVEELQPERDLSRTPLFQVLFNMVNVGSDALDMGSVAATRMYHQDPESKFDLTMYVRPDGDTARLTLVYNHDLFEKDSAAAMLRDMRALLVSVSEDPDSSVAMLPMLSRTHLAASSVFEAAPNDTLEHSIPRSFERQVSQHGERVAVCTREEAWTYSDLDRRAGSIASGLASELGTGSERVGLLFDHGAPMVASVLGALKAGKTYVPMDAGYPEERLRYMAEDAQVQALVTAQAMFKRARTIVGEQCPVFAVESLYSFEPHPSVDVDPTAPAYILYTSGSTGRPKGVMQSHRNVQHYIAAYAKQLNLSSDDRLSQFSSFGFDAAVMDIFGALLNGATLYPVDLKSETLPEAMAWLTEQGVTIYHSTPTVFRAFTSAMRDGAELPTLRAVVLGGEEVKRGDVERFTKAFPTECSLINLYGSAEASFSCAHAVSVGETSRARIAIGKAVDRTEIRLVNAYGGEEPVFGEIAVRGPHVALGYWNRDEKTATAFTADAQHDGFREYRTGDLGRRLPDGAIECLGRKDFQIKIRGYRVEPGEIESLLNQYPGVVECVVAAKETETGDTYLAAYVVAESAQVLDPASLRAHVTGKLPDYMIPAAFVTLDELPKTATGKIDRRALPAPETFGAEVGEYVAPSTLTEELLAGIWEQVLKRPRVSVHDKFFNLGGHSLMATQVVSRIRDTFGVELPLRALFEEPTVAGLTRRINALQNQSAELSAPPLVPVPRGVHMPLSFAQQRLWLLDQLGARDGAYTMSSTIQLAGVLIVPALEYAFTQLLARHESLRTVFVVDDTPYQIVHDPIAVSLTPIEIGPGSDEDRESETMRRVSEDVAVPFDLSSGPLVRIRLYRLKPDLHILSVMVHHIVSDAWSMGVLVREIQHVYEAYVSGAESRLPELPIQYPDFAHWQRSWLQGDVLDAQLAYWRTHLDGAPAVLDLPTDHPRPRVRTFRGDRVSQQLPQDLTDHLRQLGRDQGATLFMTLFAAFNALLSRYSGQTDIVAGTPIANRNRKELEALIGFFVNTLAIRTDLSGNPAFTALLQRVREAALGAYAHQDLPFERLVDALQPERDLGRSPVFQVMFVFQNAPKSEWHMPGLTLSRITGEAHRSRFDVAMAINETDAGLSVSLEYDTDLFERDRMLRMLDHYRNLLASIAAAPGTAIGAIDILGDEERALLYETFNRSVLSLDENESATHRLERRAQRIPGAIALVHNRQKLTYAELNDRANQLAHYLRAAGIGRGCLVGIVVPRSFDMIVAVLGTMKSGAAYLPIDPAYPAERIRFMIADARPSAMLTLSECAPAQHGDERTFCLDAIRDELAAQPDRNPDFPPAPDDLAYVIYTSGSTGRPKGTLLGHRGLSNLVDYQARLFSLDSHSRVLQFASLSFDASVWEIFPSLAAGSTLVLADSETISDPVTLTNLICEENITIATLPPAVLSLLNPDELPVPEILVSAGERCPLELARRWSAGRRFFNGYGPTETTVCASIYECTGDERESVPIGRPVPNTAIYLLDGNLQPVPLGVPGDLYVSGISLALGYLNRPELTAERFITVAINGASRRLYKTGDRARFRNDGALEFLGRQDSQIKLRGYRIELGEIENALRAQSDVMNAVVAVKPDATGDARLVAYVVMQSNTSFQPQDLRKVLAATLPAHMLPAAIIEVEEFPLSPTGKVDVEALPNPAIAQPRVGTVEPPQGDAECQVAAVFCDVLGIECVGRHQRFFDLGGHSLKAAQVIARLRSAFDIELPLRAIFEEPTFAGLAHYIESHRSGLSAATAEIQPVNRDRDIPLSFAQQRLWFLDRLGARDGVYTIATALRLRGNLDESALERALDHIVARHEVLRTRFGGNDSQPYQVIDDLHSVRLARIDLSQREHGEQTVEAERIVRRDALAPFDLEVGPLLRAQLIRLGDRDHVLSFSMHHSISDGWSMGVFARELAALYNAGLDDKSARLPALPVQYADFSVWQREWLQGENLRRQQEYWVEHLEGAPPVLELPIDHPRPAVQTFNGGRESLRIDATSIENLENFCRREDVTIFMTLCAAFNVLLFRYTSQDDFVIGTPIANRNRAEVENLIGFFANTLALRFRIDGEASFRGFLQQVRDVALGAYAHQDLPFEKLVEELAPTRSLAHSPLFQVMFAFQNIDIALPALQDIEVTKFGKSEGRSRFDLTVTVSRGTEGLAVHAEYNSDLYDAGTIQRMLCHYHVILNAAVSNAATPVSMLPMLTEAERTTLLCEWNDTSVDISLHRCAHELVEAQAESRPNAVALVDGATQLTYAQLNERANRLAHRLIELRVRPRSRVAVCTSRRLDTVVGLLAVWKAGAAYVPLDPAYPVERLRYMIDDSSAVALILDAATDATMPATEALHVRVEGGAERNTQPGTNPLIPVSPSDAAYAIYTSGSTGRPKGVVIEHRSLLNLIDWHQRTFRVTADDRATHLAGPAFDASVWELWPYLTIGATVFMPDNETRLSASHLRDWILSKHVTMAFLPTPLAEQAIGLDWPAACSLRTLLTGGDTLRKRPPSTLPFALVNNYGPTENTVVSTSGRVRSIDELDTAPSLGRPIDNTEVYVLDRNLQLVPVGVPGELHVGGIGLAREYLGRPDLTSEKFIPHPFSNVAGRRLYKTGDRVCYRPDGTLEFLGRTDHQVKIRGHRVELGEIESVLCKQPGVQEAVVLPRANGPSGPALAAFIVADSGHEIRIDHLRDALKGMLPIHMLPSSVTLTDSIPLSAHGKVDRDALLQQEKKSAAAPMDSAPVTDTQRAIAAIWRELLERDHVGIYDSFLDIGGHSMLAVELMARLNAAFHIELPLRVVFEEPTIAGLARRVETAKALVRGQRGNGNGGPKRIEDELIVPLRTSGSRTPIFLIAPAGGTVFAYYALAHHLGPDQPVYALQDPAFEGNRPPCETIEEMARHYVSAMRTVQPQGPYIVGGWSFGGTVAFEVAQQLNGETGVLFLIETITGSRPSNGVDRSFANRIRRMRDNIGARCAFALSGLATTVEGAWLSLTATRPLRWLHASRQKFGSREERRLGKAYEMAVNDSVPGMSGAGTMLMRQSFARHWVRIAIANTRAFRRYVLQPYPGKLTLFTAERRITARPDADPARGWSHFVRGGVEVCSLPGDHFSILRNPNAAEFARVLRECTGEVLSQEETHSDRETPTLASS